MIRYRALQLLFLVSSMTPQMKAMVSEDKGIGEGIAQRIEELPKELRYKIISFALALLENQKYELCKKINVLSKVTAVALNANNTRALAGSLDWIARVVDVEKEVVLKELKGHRGIVPSVALSADGDLALTGSYDKTVRIWNMSTGELTKTFQAGSYVTSVALSADGSIAAIGTGDSIACLYNTNTGELFKTLQVGSVVNSVALSTDGTIVLTGTNNGTLQVWNTLTGRLLSTLQVDSAVTSAALSADGTIALTETTAGEALVFDVKKGTLLNTLLSNAPACYSAALSKDGKRALLSAADGKIQIWNTKPLPGKKEPNTPLTLLEGHTGLIAALAFGGDDFIASAGSNDGTIIIWKPFALEPRGPQENVDVLWQAYKENFSRPKFLFQDGD